MCLNSSRRNFIKGALAGAMAFGIEGGIYELAFSQSVHIRFSTWHPPLSREVKTVWEPMLKEIKDKSGGQINYTIFAGAALGKGPEHFDIVAKGLSDMGYFTATWTPGRFPLADVLSLAVWVDGKDIGTDIGNALYERILHKEFTNVKVLELNGCIQSFLWTKRPVRSLRDVQGLKIRTPGGHQTNYIRSLGAEPIFMPLGDVYLAAETGTIDGVVTCPPLILAYKLYEVLKHGVVATFGCVTEGVVMNLQSWQKIPKESQKIIESIARNPFRATGGLTQKVYQEMVKEIAQKGVTLYHLPAEEAERWYERFREETRKWVADLEKKGLPAKETVRMFNQECAKRGIKVVAFPKEWA